MRGRAKTTEVITPQMVAPKQFIMYDVDEEEPSRLWTVARLEDATVDKIARRVVELLAEQKGKKK